MAEWPMFDGITVGGHVVYSEFVAAAIDARTDLCEEVGEHDRFLYRFYISFI